MVKPVVLVVEDEAAIADTILYALRSEGLAAEHCVLGRPALYGGNGPLSVKINAKQ